MANNNQRPNKLKKVNGGVPDAPSNAELLQDREQVARDRAQRDIARDLRRQNREIARQMNFGGIENGRGIRVGGNRTVNGGGGDIVRDGNPPNVAIGNQAPARGQETQGTGNAEGGQPPAGVRGVDVNVVRGEVLIGEQHEDQGAAVPRVQEPAEGQVDVARGQVPVEERQLANIVAAEEVLARRQQRLIAEAEPLNAGLRRLFARFRIPEMPLVLHGDAAERRMSFPLVMMELDNSNNSPNLDQLASREIECDISDELSDKVFENDMLREMILNHVIFSNGKVCTSGLKSVRLVRKSWLNTAAEELRKRRLPMFNLTLDAENSTTGCPHVQRHGSKLLEMFVNSMTSPTRLPDFIPPFKLHLTPEFFLNENHRNLSDCLTSCGGALVDMEVSFPISSSMVFAFHPFYLPQLKRLSVEFVEPTEPMINHNYIVAGVRNEDYGHTIYPTQIILHSADDLKELVFKYSPSDRHMPFGFEHLALPKTLTKLCLDRPVKNSDLQLLINNDLPNLNSLSLFATSTRTRYSEETLFQILDKYRESLKKFSLHGHHYPGRVLDSTKLRFPVMKSLESVAITSQCWEFQEGLRSLERQLPKMNDLRMLSTKESMFTKWTQESVYPEVTSLSVSLIDTDVRSHNPNNVEVPMTLTLQKMQSLHLAFPNVVSLELTLCGPQTRGLKYLFMEMVSLQKLAITVKGSGAYFELSYWDSLLTGISTDMVVWFQKSPDFWSKVELKDDNNCPSIRKLTALHSLALVEAFYPASSCAATASGSSLISNLSFQFAFLKMPNLTKLLLHGQFSASPQICAQWRDEKGTEIAGIREG